MIRKITSMLAAFAIALAMLAPSTADARDRRGYSDRGGHGHYGRHHGDHGDEVAAGVVGLIVGLAIGSIASQPRQDERCYDNYRRCAPPPREDGYYDQGYDPAYEQGGDPRYDEDARAQYERDYGVAPDDGGYEDGGYYEGQRQCTQQMRRWDRSVNRYVIVNVPC